MVNEQRLRRFAVFTVVAGAHVLLLMLPLETERRELVEGEGSTRRTLLFFPRTPVVESGLRRDLRSPAEPRIQTNISIAVPDVTGTESPEGASAAGSAIAPSIDWSGEARRAAAAAAEKVPIPDRSKCDSTGLADPALPNCKPRPKFEWAPPKAGFAQGLPYVMLGDRCVIGLGFFGCSLGKPPANGDLFDGMDDPDRDHSSVPDSRP
jgi:hypothetical protein